MAMTALFGSDDRSIPSFTIVVGECRDAGANKTAPAYSPVIYYKLADDVSAVV
jgi:hypothetical protein